MTFVLLGEPATQQQLKRMRRKHEGTHADRVFFYPTVRVIKTRREGTAGAFSRHARRGPAA